MARFPDVTFYRIFPIIHAVPQIFDPTNFMAYDLFRQHDGKPYQSAPVSLSLNEKEAASIPESELKKRLGVSAAGLSEEEAKKRQVQSGYNELPEARINPILKFLVYFWGPIPWMIEPAAVLSVVVKDWQDFGIILTLLVANAVVGF